MTIMIGCPLQQRAWILPVYLNSIEKIDFPKEDIHLAFLVNNSSDNTLEILHRFKDAHYDEYYDIEIALACDFDYTDNRIGNRDYGCIADVKNEWLDMRYPSDEFAFIVDSDVLVPPEVLSTLLGHQKDMISALVMTLMFRGMDFYNMMDWNGSMYVHRREWNERLLKVDYTAGCVLMSKALLDTNPRYGDHRQGEDCIFCRDAQKAGYEVFIDTGILCNHVMFKKENMGDTYVPVDTM